MEQMPTVDGEQLIASAVQYLIEGDNMDIAQLLLYCTAEQVEVVEEDNFRSTSYGVDINLRGPRMAIEKIDNESDWTSDLVRKAIANTLPFGFYLSGLFTRASIHVPDENWRSDLQELIKGKGISNQASGAESARLWQGFKFRSATEIKIAEALDRAGVLFFPLPKARVVTDNGHMNVEPDFVVCQEGRWGILEVDGEPFHPPTRSAIEHDRDRLFRRHGVVCVERFDAKRCYANPDKTVQDFLLLMVKSYRRT